MISKKTIHKIQGQFDLLTKIKPCASLTCQGEKRIIVRLVSNTMMGVGRATKIIKIGIIQIQESTCPDKS